MFASIKKAYVYKPNKYKTHFYFFFLILVFMSFNE